MRRVRTKKRRTKPGEAIQPKWKTPRELARLDALISEAEKQGDLKTW